MAELKAALDKVQADGEKPKEGEGEPKKAEPPAAEEPATVYPKARYKIPRWKRKLIDKQRKRDERYNYEGDEPPHGCTVRR